LRRIAFIAAFASNALFAGAAWAQATPLVPCRLQGIEREVRCGHVEVAENPDDPAGRKLTIHYAVVPALARSKSPDPLFVFAGGPGQAAGRVAALLQPVFAQLNARRDIVYVDQRGTGRSNPLACKPRRAVASLAEAADAHRAAVRLGECLRELDADPRQYATWIAVRDYDAVRAALGAERINLWGGSYGTRAALEYLRQFPQRVRSIVLDGVAPPDMALPASFAVDSEGALRKMLADCAQDAACRQQYPRLDDDIDRLLASAATGLDFTVPHPVTGQAESLKLDRAAFVGLLRAPLYAPNLAAVMPFALAEASRGEFAPLMTLSTSLAARVAENFAEGMHFAVICAEDLPRIDHDAADAARHTRFGTAFIELYREACRQVAVRAVPADFYVIGNAEVPVLLLSGGADPATPPRHGEAVAKRLSHARHLVASHLGHGVSAQGCAPGLITRFVRQADFEGIDGACLERIPAPKFLRPIETSP
jgi:pimeloyl-ACP methyl ester carboxylesterase